MFARKTPKSESDDKSLCTFYYPHNIPINNRNWYQEYIQIASVDPGYKNYSLRIERRWKHGLIEPLVYTVFEIKDYEETIVNNCQITIDKTFKNLTNELSKYNEFFINCHYLIIEKQLVENYKSTLIMVYTRAHFSYLIADQPLLAHIVEISPKLKGKKLDPMITKGMNKKQLKSWAITKALELFQNRGDNFSYNKIMDSKKKDDLADTACQIEAFCIIFLKDFKDVKDVKDVKDTNIKSLKLPLKKFKDLTPFDSLP